MPISTDSIKFQLQNSLIDARGGLIPVFLRSSPTSIERGGADDITLTEIASSRPAICPDDGAIILHPEAKNEISWNATPSHNSWIKGSYVSTVIDRDPSIDRTYLAERVIWTAGSGNTQILRKEVLLEAGKVHCLSFIVKLDAGAFRPGDVVRVVGGVTGTAQISLSNLNKDIGKRRKLAFNFQTTGGVPSIPQTGIDYYSIADVTATTVAVGIGAGIVADALVGAQLIFTQSTTKYIITANGASDLLGNVTISVASPTLVSNGINVGGRVKIDRPPLQVCRIELYCENVATIEWGSIQIEKRDFPTAQIVQKEVLELRSASLLYFNRSPLAGKANFGLYLDIKRWAGDGNIFQTTGLELKIVNGFLVALVGGTSISTPAVLPHRAKVFLQVATEQSRASLFVDGKLAASATISSFVGAEGVLTLTSLGAREYFSISIIEGVLKSGDPTLGSDGKLEIEELFSSDNLIAGVSLLQKVPELILPATIVPPTSVPPQSVVISKDLDLRRVVVREDAGFTEGSIVTIENEGIFILEATILAKSGTTLTLDVPVAIVSDGYSVRQGDSVAGKATIRFPFDPIDVQEIVSIGVGNVLILSVSALSFDLGRAIVQDEYDRFVSEVIILSINTQTRQLVVDSVENIFNGYKISQPSAELLVDPDNYLASFTQPSKGVSFTRLAQNGLEIENTNSEPITVTPTLKIIL